MSMRRRLLESMIPNEALHVHGTPARVTYEEGMGKGTTLGNVTRACATWDTIRHAIRATRPCPWLCNEPHTSPLPQNATPSQMSSPRARPHHRARPSEPARTPARLRRRLWWHCRGPLPLLSYHRSHGRGRGPLWWPWSLWASPPSRPCPRSRPRRRPSCRRTLPPSCSCPSALHGDMRVAAWAL